MTAAELLREVTSRGVRVEVHGGALVLRGPVSALPAGTVDRLRVHKQDVIGHLRRGTLRPTKADLLARMGDAAAAIHGHLEICRACPPLSAFTAARCCSEGWRLWKEHREIRKAWEAAK